MSDNPSIRTLAKLAGVSNATVSLALRNHPRIRPEVRERIQRIARKAGYRANPIAAQLLAQLRATKTATYQSTLGLLLASHDRSIFEEVPTFREWLLGCRERASVLGYRLDELVLSESGLSPQRLLQILDTRGIRGLVVVGPFDGNVIPPEFDPIWERSAVTVIGVRPINPTLAFVSNDQFTTATQAMQETLRLGYKRPALCINSDLDSCVEQRFSGGYIISQRRLPAKNRIPIFDFQPDAEERFRLWLDENRPDAIITSHCEIQEWVETLGLSIPAEIALVHLDVSSDIPWAGVCQNNRHIGRAAVDMVIGQLHRNEYGVPPFQRCMSISGTWVPGPTVRKKRRPSRNRRARA